jgi:type III pantothenate kinase
MPFGSTEILCSIIILLFLNNCELCQISMTWLALSIGNSRLHWAWWQGRQRQATWHCAHLATLDHPETWGWPAALLQELGTRHWSILPLYVASVVPSQTALWQPYARGIIRLEQIPLGNLYPTLGIDRALAAYGAGETYGYPVLAIDGGTALTLTGIDERKQLVGGAILPGLGLQLQSLGQGTAQLPSLSWEIQTSVERWSRDTSGAIWGGVLYSAIAGLQDFGADWQQRFPGSPIILTGGDGALLANGLAKQLAVTFDPDLIWAGMELVIASQCFPPDNRANFG